MRLVGGTALALQIGHRKSIDIDLFGSIEINNLMNLLSKYYNQVRKTVSTKSIVTVYFNII